MPIRNISYKVDTDVVKEEGKGRYSRDDVTLAATTVPLEVGTVLTADAAGVHSPITTAAPGNASAILLEYVPITTGQTKVVVLARRAQVALQALVWPAGATEPNKTAAMAALKAKGIVPRNGV